MIAISDRRNPISVFLSVAEQTVVAAVVPACAAAAESAVAPFVRSVADGVARLAAFSRRWLAASSVAGVLFPAAAEVFAGLFLAARRVFPAASGISGPAWSFPCLDEQAAQSAEAR